MQRSLTIPSVILALVLALPAAAQKNANAELAQGQLNTLLQAQQALAAAETAGARTAATSLYDDATWRLKYAQENWNSAKDSTRQQARMRADEALWEARTALAKSRWLGTNAAIRGLQGDITRFGGSNNVTVQDEAATINYNRGTTSTERIAAAQAAIDQANAVCGWNKDKKTYNVAMTANGNQTVATSNSTITVVSTADAQSGCEDVRVAQGNLESARKIVRGDKSSEAADHLALTSELMARRAYYLARAVESGRYLPNLQLERTRLAQAESERSAAVERQQREQAERASADLQRQLAAEQANRQAQQAELDRLHQQIDENRRAQEAKIEADRQARVAAERALDEAMTRYESAMAGSGSPSDIDTLRRQVEDQQIALRSIQDREQLGEQGMSAEIEGLRRDLAAAQQAGSMNADVLSQRQAELIRRQAELDTLRKERQEDLARRADLDKQQQAALADAQQRRAAAEAQTQQLRQQAEQAQAAANQAQQAAQQAAAQAAAQAQQASQQQQATQAELERTRTQLAERDAEARRLRMEQELSKIASTRRDARGLIVTLSGGILFDTGKSALKPGAKSTLTKIAAQLKSDDALKIAVEGHTDSVGSEASNQTLSEKRAAAVRDYLVSAGVPDGRISSAGKGEGEPIASNKTAAGRQQNRRVELVITQ